MINKNIEIWNDGEYSGADKEFKPILSTYIIKDMGNNGDGITVNTKKRGAVLICPGGGYGFLSYREAEPIAMQFISAGFHAFVLYYSVSPNRHPQPLYDVTRAMCIIRENAEEWLVDTDKIAVAGFSAGGHLAASHGVFWNDPMLLNVPKMEQGKNKPNALILSYPVISGVTHPHIGSFENLLGKENLTNEALNNFSLEKKVTKDTPPSFIWHTFEDSLVPVENSLMFANALKEKDIPFELHIYPKGSHGLSLANSEVCDENGIDPHVASWMGLCTEWLNIQFN